jgi:dTDP-glucose pyrophosphorylase
MNKIYGIFGVIILSIIVIGCVMQQNNSKTNNVEITDMNGNVITEGCQSWFDGCNTCQVNLENPDMPMACTRMACDPMTLKPARCMDEDSIKADKIKCSEAGGVWSEEQNSCFEDPSTMK